MPMTDAQRRAKQKYQSGHQKTLACPVNLDEYARFKAYAERNGKTISGALLEYVRKCITEAEQVVNTEQTEQTTNMEQIGESTEQKNATE